MERSHGVLTLVLVAIAAMLLGLAVSLLVAGRVAAPRRETRPKATEPARQQPPAADGARRAQASPVPFPSRA